MDKPRIKDLFRHVDDRGILDMVTNFDLPFELKRIYTTKTKRETIRGIHGHLEEWKAFYIVKGSAKFMVFPMTEIGFVESEANEVSTFVLDERKPQLLIVPKGYYHGYASLSEEADLVILSSATLDESKQDDHRLDPFGYEKYFEVVNR